MARIQVGACSSAPLSPSLGPSLSLSSSSSRLHLPVSPDYRASRRLALFHLTTAIPLSPLFDVKASTLLRSEGTIIEASTAANMAQPSTFVTEENAFKWVKNDKRRMLHVVYRVGDLDKTIKFYTECLGMKLLRKRDIPEERYSNAFLGYGPEDSHFTVELTYNYGVDKYDIGTGFGHFGIAVEDQSKKDKFSEAVSWTGRVMLQVAKTVDLVKAKGGKVTRDPGPVKGGNTVIAFVKDPDGYTFELLERGPTPEPLCQVMLRVGDLDRAINFYKKAYGMELLRKRDNPEYKNCPYTIAMMGYGPEDKNAVVELTYNYGVREYDKGNAYAQIAIGTNDVYKTAEAIQLCGGKIILEPGPLPGINTKITACLDPDGWKSGIRTPETIPAGTASLDSDNKLASSGELLQQNLLNGDKLPFLVRLRSSPPLETKFNAIETFASSTCSSVRDILVVPYPFSSLAFSVAAPLKAALVIGCLEVFHERKYGYLELGVIPVAAPAVRAMISPLFLALIAEPTTAKIWSCSAPISSAISIQCDATRAAADAIAVDVLEGALCRAVGFSGDVTDEAARAATAAATPATDTAA
ncbi:unnamed protein product [Camellia sinensis]